MKKSKWYLLLTCIINKYFININITNIYNNKVLSFTLHWITLIFGLADGWRKKTKLNRAPIKSPNSTPNITQTKNVTIAATASFSAIKNKILLMMKYKNFIWKSQKNVL